MSDPVLDPSTASGRSDPSAPGADGRPQVTVAMPAHNAAPFLRQAITSVLAQRDVALELIVVDDASHDDTAAIAAATADPRLIVLRNPQRRGIGACHNIILRHARAPVIAHVDADDYILPGALRRMVAALAADPAAGQAHCHYFDVDCDGLTTRAAFAARWRLFHDDRPPGLDYRQALQRRCISNALRTFPRHVLEALGGFDEHLRFGMDYDIALRVAERHRIVLVPEFLYARRLHRTNTMAALRLRPLRVAIAMHTIRRRLLRQRRITFGRAAYRDAWPLLRDQWHALTASLAAAGGSARRLATVVRWRLWAPCAAALSTALRARLADLPLPARRRGPPPARARIAYYVRRYPAASETFIRREVAALRARGVPLDVITEGPHDPARFDDEARAAAAAAICLGPLGARAPAARRALLWQRPWTALRVYAYVRCRRHAAEKHRDHDRVLWYGALRLAGVLTARGATHVHAPWATGDALVALLAARLAGIGCSVQARASDLYKDTAQPGLGERLRHADLIITNAHYNEPTIRAWLPAGAVTPIHVVREGIDLDQLRPGPRPANAVPVILTVARLVEPKGIDVLLRAAAILRDAGRAVRWEIIGGREAREITHALALARLHRALALDDVVHFLGARPFAAVRAGYAAADLYVLPARPAADGRRDVTPNTIIEAMAMGLPIVSTRSGAIPELVEDGVSGLLVPPCDAAALAAAVARLLDDEGWRRALGAGARAAAEARFDLAATGARLAALFAATAAPAARGRAA